jgi:hypothetical protein
MREGIILGAVVGLGFAALENAGYAFNALFTVEGLSLRGLVETEVLRGVLTPVGHGVWTAILGGVLFRAAAARGRLQVDGAVVGWYRPPEQIQVFTLTNWGAAGPGRPARPGPAARPLAAGPGARANQPHPGPGDGHDASLKGPLSGRSRHAGTVPLLVDPGAARRR